MFSFFDAIRIPNKLVFHVFPTCWIKVSFADIQGKGVILHGGQHPLSYNSEKAKNGVWKQMD